jgi:hypothetical protein
MLFNVSKQAVNPGKGFGAYGLAEGRDLLPGPATGAGIWRRRCQGQRRECRPDPFRPADRRFHRKSRAEARGVSAGDYMAGNLLKAEVEAHHVADAFVSLAKSERTTAHVITVDGGNIEAALR